jgi:NAD(P)-dependent dehydrogenase (short-subunit alcohol dehydrogenase family)
MPRLLVTGGSRGIGRATALRAATRGWSVAIGYVGDRAAAERTAADIAARGVPAACLRADIAEEAEVVAMFDGAAAALGGLDAVVVNAGIVAPAMPLAEMGGDRLRRMFDVNVLGSYLCAREAARRLSRGRGGPGGAIVVVSSMAARLGSPNEYVDYAGAKGALDTLVVGLARELGPEGVRVNGVRPGLIETDIHASGGRPDRAKQLGAGSPLGRAGEPEEVAEAILWLLGEGASYTTGTLIDVAGGR